MKDFPALCQGSREGNVSSAIREEAHLDNRMAKWKWSPNYCANQASSAGDQLLPRCELPTQDSERSAVTSER